MIEIPNKSSFKINEVCALTGVKSYVLRFWESEFSEIAPLTSSSGVKLYEHKDIEAILLIKKLLFEDKLTVERAKAEMHILMPRENLIEDKFYDIDELERELVGDEYKDAAYFEKSSIKAYPQREFAQSKRVLIESDFEKLLMAKTKLVEILNKTEVLKEKNSWS